MMDVPAFLAAATLLTCPAILTDVAPEVGLRFVHDRGASGEFRLPETMGAGLAWLDYDGDGWMDLYVVQSGPFPPSGDAAAQDRLFRNVKGRFVDVTREAGLADAAYGMGAFAADYDSDGDPDLLVTNLGSNILFRNDGDGTFTDVTEAAGLLSSGWHTAAAWADIEGDGDLDLFVARYVDYSAEQEPFCGNPITGARDYCHPDLYRGTTGRLFRNDGDGTFTDVTGPSGLAQVGKGLGAIFTDIDLDGLPDLYVANDNVMNFLFHNRGDGTFAEIGLISGAGFDADGNAQAGMGVDAGDLDGDGRLDLVVTNFDVEFNAHYRNRGAGQFDEISAQSGFGPPSFNFLAFGISLADFDRDGWLDAFVANGHIQTRPTREGVTYAQRDLLLWNDGSGRFREQACGPAFESSLVGRGSAVADFDNDGDLDVAVANSGGPLQLLRNDGAGGSWIGVRLRGRRSNRQGVGARIVIETTNGTQLREALAGRSYLSSSDPRILFGLGSAAVERLRVYWPSGTVQDLTRPEPGQYHTIEEPSGLSPADR